MPYIVLQGGKGTDEMIKRLKKWGLNNDQEQEGLSLFFLSIFF